MVTLPTKEADEIAETNSLSSSPVHKVAIVADDPRDFLAKCRAIVDSVVVSPIDNVPRALRHRAKDFKPKARAAHLRRRQGLQKPEWTLQSVRQTETLLGTIMIIVSCMLFNIPTDDYENLGMSLESALCLPDWFGGDRSKLTSTSAESELPTPMKAEPPADPIPEMPFYKIPFPSESRAVDYDELSQVNAPVGCSGFHSYADPATRFSFENEPSWKTRQLMSTHHACNVAHHLEQNLTLMVRNGPSPVWNDFDSGRQSARILRGRHPLVRRMMSHSRQATFETYMSANKTNPSKVSMMRAMNGFRHLSGILQEAWATAPAGDSDGSAAGE